MQTYPSRRLLANSLANEINTIKNEPGFGYSDILHETSDGVQLLALLCSINPISDDQSLRQAFHSIGLLLFTLKSFCSFFPFFLKGRADGVVSEWRSNNGYVYWCETSVAIQ